VPQAIRNRSDSPTKTCTEPGCDRPLRAQGFCVTHYNGMRGGDWAYPKVQVPCGWCGKVTLKPKTSRYSGRYCSTTCKGAGYSRIRVCPVPDAHPSRSCHVPPDHPSRIPTSCPVPATHPSRLIQRRCEWCDSLTARLRYCSDGCKRRASVARRRGREADGRTYSWSHVMRVLLLLKGRCAYCDQVVIGPPDPDHVVPISRGGSNGNANILPCCKACNSDKRDLLLHEWNADRARRGLAPVRTAFDRSVPAFAHLLPDVFASAHAA
jgi:hypothetical protein